MRRRAIGERVEKESEAVLCLLVRKAECLEHARLHILPVNSNAAGAELVAVEDDVVAFRAAFPRRGFEFVDILFENSGKWMLCTHPALIALAPFKQREAGNPQELPFAAVDQIQPVAEVETDLTGHTERSVVVLDLFLRGRGDDQIPRFRANGFGQQFQAVRTEIFL